MLEVDAGVENSVRQSVIDTQIASPPASSPYTTLGMFDVDISGRLSANRPDANLGMRFNWRGRPVIGALHGQCDGLTGSMLFRIWAGRIPSSSIAAEARPDAFALLRYLPALLPELWTLRVGADHSLELESVMPVAMPAHIKDLLVPAVQFCLAACPFLDLLEENAIGLGV